MEIKKMINGRFYKLMQNKRVEYENMQEDRAVAKSSIPLLAPKEKLYHKDSINGDYKLRNIPPNKLKSITEDLDKGNISYTIHKNEQRVGYICSKKQGGFWNPFLYDEMVFNNIKYNIYFVALGEKGKKILFYKSDGNEEIQIGEVSKSNEVIDRLDEYFYKTVDELYTLPIVLYLLFFDFRRNLCYWGELIFKGKEVEVSKTKDQRLLDKYNPYFNNKG